MKPRLREVMIGLLTSLAAMAAATDVTGTWAGKISDRGRNYTFIIVLNQSGGKLAGTVNGAPPHGEKEPIMFGKVDGRQITFQIRIPTPNGHTEAYVYKGQVSGD